MKVRLLCFCLVCVFCVLLTACGMSYSLQNGERVNTSHKQNADEQDVPVQAQSVGQSEPSSSEFDEITFSYAMNIEPEFDIPDYVIKQIRKGMANLDETIHFNLFDKPEAIDVAVLRACYLLGISDIGFDSSYTNVNGMVSVKLRPEYLSSFKVRMWLRNPRLESKLDDADKMLYERAQSVIQKLSSDSKGDAQIALALHDYLIDTVAYPADENEQYFDPRLHEAVGALVDGTAVCDGYADAYQLLLDMAQIDNLSVVGIADGEPHGWNLVYLNGQWYHVDVTWDDPIVESDEPTSVYYGYFLISDEWMKEDHTWETTQYPKAVDDSMNPYAIEGRVARSYEEFKALMKDSIANGETDIDVYIINYFRADYPLDFLSSLLGEFYYQQPDEGKNGVFRVHQTAEQSRLAS